MAKGNLKKNIRDATSRQSITDILIGSVAGAVIYSMLPTVLNLSGAVGMVVGAGTTWLVGAVTGQKGIQYAGPALATLHLAYVFAQGVVTDALGRPIWQYDQTATPAPLSDYVNYGGERIMAAAPTDMPEPNTALMDYIPQPQLSGYGESSPTFGRFATSSSFRSAFEQAASN